MAYTEILENCHHSIGGIKDFKIATRCTDGTPISFPLDVTFVTGSTDTITFVEDFDSRTITIGGCDIEFRYVFPKTVTFKVDKVGFIVRHYNGQCPK